jgi:hypothetical protein
MAVKVRREILGFPGDECDCGRRASILHCNACGSTRIYARSNRPHTHLSGEMKFVDTQYRCQTCGHEFIQEERQFCDAPPISDALARLKVKRLAEAAKRGEYLRPEEQKAADALLQIIKDKETQITSVEALEASVSEEIKKLADEAPSSKLDKLPEGLSQADYDVADRAFRLEWAHLKLAGQDTGISVEEYVERRLKGELFQ